MDRRKFLKKAAIGGGFLSLGAFPYASLAHTDAQYTKLTILHTNDVHSRIDPFPADSGRNAGRGGAERRAALIKQIRAQEENVLLLDSGDMWQGTPYFNLYGGEVEFKVMSDMKYDAATIGNHDFDAGMEGLKKQLPHAQFDIINSNYDFSDTILKDTFKPYKIYQKGNIKVGILGLGIELDGLVPETMYDNTKYLDPVRNAQKYASHLKHDEKCDLVICLSHLGYNYRGNKICDTKLAESTSDIDIILGGHTHTFMKKPDLRMNRQSKQVAIHQVGFGGLLLGRMDVTFETTKRSHCISCDNTWVKA